MYADTLILGSGYAGLNAYYYVRNKNKLILSDSLYFKFYTGLWNSNFEMNSISVKLNFVKTDNIKDIDIKARCVKTTHLGEICSDTLIIGLGCDKTKVIRFIADILHQDSVAISAENPYDDYLIVQLAFYLRKLGKDVKYYGNYMSWLGDKVSEVLSSLMKKYNIKQSEKAEYVLPSCEPSFPLGFLKVNEKLEVYNNVYAIGDIIYGWPKLGELAMREGVFIGKKLSKAESSLSSFSPIFITIIDTLYGEGLHIRSDVPWGGNYVSVKRSKLRALMKKFIERYYIFSKGKMGILYYL